MKLNVVMTVNAVVAAVFGLAFVFVPGQLLMQYGVTADAPLKFIGQLFGTALVGYAVLTWSARSAGDSDARKAIVLAMFVGNGVGFIIALIGQLQRVVNSLGWSTVAIYLILALGFASVLLGKRSAA